MGFIPPNAKWYLAYIVEEIRVEGERRNVLHTNQVLVRADSPDEAYEESLKLGRQCNISYRNERGKKVGIKFRGLRELSVVHDELEHGAELSYRERIGVSEQRIKEWIQPKSKLNVFAPIQPTSGPDYADGRHYAGNTQEVSSVEAEFKTRTCESPEAA